jgi:hypothetical protein
LENSGLNFEILLESVKEVVLSRIQKHRVLGLLIPFYLIANIWLSPAATATGALLLNTSNGTFGAWNQSANSIYLNKITGVAGTQITEIRSGWAFNISTQASTNTVYLFNDNSGVPGSVAATFTFSSHDGANWASYTGSYTVPAGGTFFIGQRASAPIANAGGAVANQVANSWSISYANRFSGSSLTGPFTQDPVYSAPIWQIYGASSTQLTSPAVPKTSVTSSAVTVSETATVANASSYQIRLFQSNGTTLIETKTATASTIVSGVTFTGLTPNTSYRVGVIAIGDGATYSDSVISTLASFTTEKGLSSAVLNIIGSPPSLTYRTSYQIRATITGSTGFVAFRANGKPISQCRKVAIASSLSTCAWRPSTHGVVALSASVTSTDSNYLGSQASGISVSVVKRTNTR